VQKLLAHQVKNERLLTIGVSPFYMLCGYNISSADRSFRVDSAVPLRYPLCDGAGFLGGEQRSLRFLFRQLITEKKTGIRNTDHVRVIGSGMYCHLVRTHTGPPFPTLLLIRR
jgi:hypothetical protein